MNVELARKVQQRILAEPESLDMVLWEKTIYERRGFFRMKTACGTTCCIAGHAIRESGGVVPDHPITPGQCARVLLDIPSTEKEMLFHLHDLSKNGVGTPYRDLALKLQIYPPRTPQYAAIVAEAIDLCIGRMSTPDKPCAELSRDNEVLKSMGISAEETTHA